MKLRECFFLSRAIRYSKVWHNSLYFVVFVDLCYRLNDDGVYQGKLLPVEVHDGNFNYIHDVKEKAEFRRACNWLIKNGYISATKLFKPYRLSEYVYKVELGEVGKKYVSLS